MRNGCCSQRGESHSCSFPERDSFPKSDVLAEKHILNASGCGRPGGTRHGGGRKVEGGSRGGEAWLHSLPASQVNNCTTSRRTKELAQLLTQGRWESRQHKTPREGVDLLCGPKAEQGVCSARPTNPARIHRRSHVPPRKGAGAACLSPKKSSFEFLRWKPAAGGLWVLVLRSLTLLGSGLGYRGERGRRAAPRLLSLCCMPKLLFPTRGWCSTSGFTRLLFQQAVSSCIPSRSVETKAGF